MADRTGFHDSDVSAGTAVTGVGDAGHGARVAIADLTATGAAGATSTADAPAGRHAASPTGNDAAVGDAAVSDAAVVRGPFHDTYVSKGRHAVSPTGNDAAGGDGVPGATGTVSLDGVAANAAAGLAALRGAPGGQLHDSAPDGSGSADGNGYSVRQGLQQMAGAFQLPQFGDQLPDQGGN